MKPRQLLLGLVLAAALAAAFWPQPEAPELAAAAPRRAQQPARLVIAAAAGTSRQGADAGDSAASATRLGAMAADLFPQQTWRPPPPPPPKLVPLPPPAPVAPPLPFQFVGRWQEGGAEVIFLARGGNLIKTRVGDSLAGWRLDQATSNVLTFTWIALNLQQTLRIAP